MNAERSESQLTPTLLTICGIDDRWRSVHYNSGRHYAEAIQELNLLAYHLSTRPDTVPAYQLRLYPITLERSASLSSQVYQERLALDLIQTAYEEERERVEDEWKRGRERIKERLLEGIEERRRRAREEKEGEGTGAGTVRSALRVDDISEDSFWLTCRGWS